MNVKKWKRSNQKCVLLYMNTEQIYKTRIKSDKRTMEKAKISQRWRKNEQCA